MLCASVTVMMLVSSKSCRNGYDIAVTLLGMAKEFQTYHMAILFESNEQWWPEGRPKIIIVLTSLLPVWVSAPKLQCQCTCNCCGIVRIFLSLSWELYYQWKSKWALQQGWSRWEDESTHNSSTRWVSAPKLYVWVSTQRDQCYSQNLCRALRSRTLISNYLIN